MPNRLLTRFAWAAAGAAVALAPRLIELARRSTFDSAPTPHVPETGADHDPDAEPSSNGAPLPLQQLTRYRHADGTHSIHGTLLAEFLPGDRTAMLAIAFCPPFERRPAVEVETVDDSGASVKVTQVLHNGIHLEVRLPQVPDDLQFVALELLAADPTT